MAATAQASVGPHHMQAAAPAKGKQSVKVAARLTTKAKLTTKTKMKPSAPATPPAPVSVPRPPFSSHSLSKGDWLDVMDEEGTWNVGQIISEPSEHAVEVTYDGWGPEYNQVIPINSGRIAPFHTFTWAVKCWAKYDSWPWWPSVVTFRSPGNARGQEYLMNETKVFVDFLDHKDVTKRCRRWIELSQIKPYHPNANFFRKATSTRGFKASSTRLLLSSARESFDPLVEGTALPVEFRSKLPFSVLQLKGLLGLDKWTKILLSSQVRHGEVFAYQPPSVQENLGFGVEDIDDDDDGEDDLGAGGRSGPQ